MSSASASALLPLLRMSINAQQQAPAVTPSSSSSSSTTTDVAPSERVVKEMSKEDRRWLEEAMTELTKNPVDEMIKLVKFLKEHQGGDNVDDQLRALQGLLAFTEDIDLARDLHKIQGLELVVRLIDSSPHAQVRASACEVLAATTANNPEPQLWAMELNAIPILSKLLTAETSSFVEKQKAIFAVSSIVRQNDKAYVEFVNKQQGFQILHAVLSTFKDKEGLPARKKAVFLLLYLITRAPATAKPMAPGFCPVLVACVQADAEDDPSFAEHAKEVLDILSRHL